MIKWERCSNELPTTQFLILNIALGFGHFITILNAGAYLPMLPYVAGSIGEGLPYVVWGQSNYFAAMGVAFLIARPLMLRFGAVNTAISAYTLFALSCIFVLLTTSIYPLMTAARTLQGFSAGLSLSPSLSILLMHYKKPKQHIALGLWGIAAFTPFSIGPALGGFFAFILGDWKLLFSVSACLITIVAVIICILHRKNVSQSDKFYPIQSHLFLFSLFAIACFALQEFFNIGLISALTSREDELWLAAAIFCFFSAFFWFKNNSAKYPLLNFKVFKYPNYAFGLIMLCLAFMALQSSIVQYLIRLQLIEGYSAWHAGLMFLPIFVFSKPLNIMAQYFIHHGYDPRMLACISCFGFAISFWWMSSFARPAPWESLLWPQFLEGAAMGLLLISMTTIALSNVPAEEQLHAVDILNTFRNIAAGLAITLSDIGWDHYVANVKNYITFQSSFSKEALTAHFYGLGLSEPEIQHVFRLKVNSVSGLLTLNTMFYTLTLIFILLGVMVWWANPKHIVHKATVQDSVVESLGEEP
ncbi:MAG TPA: MFS transporter [Methylotenera sp.]|jgi:DHA2 family multidrug resistance protein